MTKKPNAAALIDKYVKGLCTPEEAAWVEAAFNEELRENTELYSEEEITEAHFRIKAVIAQHVAHDSKATKMRRWSRFVAAASVVLLLGGGLFYFVHRQSQNEHFVEVAHVVQPGGNKAYLRMADGRQIELSSLNQEVIVGDSIYYEDGQVVSGLGEGQSMTLHTPRGGQYRLTLPDGTKVWLNAASSISYPTHFGSNQREVEISGEVYFEVAHDARRPFIVHSDKQEIEVLGTRFNVRVYPDEEEVYSTLAEGRVRVLDIARGSSALLSPGQQSVVSGRRPVVVKNVDISGILAWTMGRFSFDNKSFDEVMQELGRWYDLDIVYTGEVPKETFFGGAFRNNELAIVLDLLESAEIDYQIKGKQLTINYR